MKGHDHAHHKEDLAERLKQAHLSITPSRLAILELLHESHRVWSIEQLIEALKRRPKALKGSLVFTTIYRCLLKLEEAKMVRRVDFGDGVSRFEFDTGEGHHHHHIVCTQCNAIEALEDCHIKEIEKNVKKLGYQNISHRMEFFGLCKGCS